MAADLSFDLHGADALEAKLQGLKADVRQKGGRSSLRKAANLVRDEVKRRAAAVDDPETPENIADNVTIKFDSKHLRATGDLKMVVGVRGGSSSRRANQLNPGGDTWYWRLLEFGTENMAAQPFMRPALTESIDAATTEFITRYDKAIDRALRRAAKGQG